MCVLAISAFMCHVLACAAILSIKGAGHPTYRSCPSGTRSSISAFICRPPAPAAHLPVMPQHQRSGNESRGRDAIPNDKLMQTMPLSACTALRQSVKHGWLLPKRSRRRTFKVPRINRFTSRACERSCQNTYLGIGHGTLFLAGIL